MARVTRLSVAPVKGLALLHPKEIQLGARGAAENRRFFLIDAAGRRYGLIRDGTLVQIRPEYLPEEDRLLLRFPTGHVAEGTVELGAPVSTDFYGRDVGGRVVIGPWADAISAHVGQSVRLVQADEPGGGVDRDQGPVSVISEGSVAELERHSGRDVDARRFRMLITIGESGAHEEDTWLGRRVRFGAAVVLVHDAVARCAITGQNPETGIPDLDTLRQIKAYRGVRDGKLIDFGVFGEVDRPGRVAIGDRVELS